MFPWNIVSMLWIGWYWKDRMINGNYYKIFVSLNKNNISLLKSQMEKFDKVYANHYIIGEFEKSFFKFLKKLWNQKSDS